MSRHAGFSPQPLVALWKRASWGEGKKKGEKNQLKKKAQRKRLGASKNDFREAKRRPRGPQGGGNKKRSHIWRETREVRPKWRLITCKLACSESRGIILRGVPRGESGSRIYIQDITAFGLFLGILALLGASWPLEIVFWGSKTAFRRASIFDVFSHPFFVRFLVQLGSNLASKREPTSIKNLLKKVLQTR